VKKTAKSKKLSAGPISLLPISLKPCAICKIHNYQIIKRTKGHLIKKIAYYLQDKIYHIIHTTLPPQYAQLYTSLIFGDFHHELDSSTIHRFQKLGLIHLIIVSGAQISILIGLLSHLCQMLYLRSFLTFLIITLINLFFFFIIGPETSITRAIIIAEILLFLKIFHRKTSYLHLFSLTILIMLIINPLYLYDKGAQLSFLASFSLIFGLDILRPLFSFIPPLLRESILVSLTPLIFTSPLLLFYNNHLSPLWFFNNCLIIPFVEFLVITGFFSTIIGFFFLPLTQLINNFNLLILYLLEKIVFCLSKIPSMTINLKHPTWPLIFLIYFFIFSIFFTLKKQHKTLSKKLFLCLLCTLAFLILPTFLPNSFLTVTFLDVGQGDAIYINVKNQKHILIDGGPKNYHFKHNIITFDAGAQLVAPFLCSQGVNRLDLIITSHFHRDHYGGLTHIMQNFPVNALIDNHQILKNNYEYLITAHNQHIPRYAAQANFTIPLAPDITLKILYPHHIKTFPKNYFSDNENNNSVVVKLSYKNIDFLFMGDLEQVKEHYLIQQYHAQLNSEIIKIGHHGAANSTCPKFLQHVQPQFAIISVGKNNKYGHPAKQLISRLQNHPCQILRTDRQGAIQIKTNGHKIWTKTYFP
jgi:competence protein ComEC